MEGGADRPGKPRVLPRAAERGSLEDAGGIPSESAGAFTESFDEFFAAEHQRLFGALYLLTGDRSEAEDLMQLAFLKVWERWSFVQRVESPSGYLYRTAMNAHRSARRRALVAGRRLAHRVVRNDPLEQVDARHEVDRLLATMTPRERMAIVLCELLELPHEEAARRMHIAESTLRVLLARAKGRARRSRGAGDG
jgi:RNA polymerase sigma factor (sigma-70 family)